MADLSALATPDLVRELVRRARQEQGRKPDDDGCPWGTIDGQVCCGWCGAVLGVQKHIAECPWPTVLELTRRGDLRALTKVTDIRLRDMKD